MNKFIMAIGCVLVLAGCSPTTSRTVTVTQQQFIPVGPSKALLNCPNHDEYPDPETMTNRDLIGVITNYEDVHGTCRANARAAYNQTVKQEAEIERLNNELKNGTVASDQVQP